MNTNKYILFANGFSARRKMRKTAGVYIEVHDCRDRVLQQSRKFISEEYIVHKFGGSSLANAARFKAIKQLLMGKQEIIVVSAIKTATTSLQKALDLAKSQTNYSQPLEYLAQAHITLIRELLEPTQQEANIKALQQDLSDIKAILHAVTLVGSYSQEIQELILGYGEQWSAKILTTYLANTHHTFYLNATQVLFVSKKNGIIAIDWQKSQKALSQFLENKTFDQLVITGFIASTPEGKKTILGRNGSDFSAAIFAKLFKAQKLIIWTDVDGIYSADPNKVKSAFPITSLSYQEAFELAYFGAKVLHPKTIAPAIDANIPIFIKNSFNPEAEGTCICNKAENSLATSIKKSHPVKGLSSMEAIALINIEGTGMMGVSGIAARVFTILQLANISVIFISQASSEHSICFAVTKNHADLTLEILKENLQFEIEQQQIQRIYADTSCAILAAVGDEMVGTIGISGKLFSTLAKANINVRAIAQGSSERNISIVVKDEDINRALAAVHSGFYLSNKTISLGLIGPGLIGRTLLKQIHAATNHLKEKYKVNLCIRGIMDSKKMLLSDEAMDLTHWDNAFSQTQTAANLNDFIAHILTDDIPHAAMIDCTASKEVAEHYTQLIEAGLHIITPNKHANAGDLNNYKKLKALLEKTNCHYLYETTVCAGLPVITTLQDIIKTGDAVISIKGIVSGTLSFVFNEMAKGRNFSEIILDAKQRGFTEPDPREDLSGMDVARKLVCLAREIGFDASLEAINVHNLVPEDLRTCSVEEFLARLPEYDAQIQGMVTDAKTTHQRLYYACSIDHQGKMNVAIEAFPESHPFASLRGTDNMLIFYTHRYHEQPLVIQGPGAGAEVTAAGIFADLLRLVSFLS